MNLTKETTNTNGVYCVCEIQENTVNSRMIQRSRANHPFRKHTIIIPVYINAIANNSRQNI